MSSVGFPIENWLLKLPLYTAVTIDSGVEKAIQAILLYGKTIDSYCPECQKNATFHAVISESSQKLWKEQTLNRTVVSPTKTTRFSSIKDSIWRLPTFSKAIECTRAKHIIYFHFVSQSSSIIKIGQYPSLADLAIGNTKQFSKVLGSDRLKELNKAIGLAAHGIGIGSYVYLRRVFEFLIEEAHQEARKDGDWDERDYQQQRGMKEKIAMLKNFLPLFIIQHPELYGILSRGIHELTEKQCLDSFEALKEAILVIAQKRLHNLQREIRYSEASRAIKSVSNKIAD